MIDKNQAIIEYLSNCPVIAENKLFFNFAEESENINQLIPNGNSREEDQSFVDGSVLRQYTFTLFVYKAITYNPVVKESGYIDENVGDLSDVQSLLDWFVEQNNQLVFPNFGEKCIIESVEPQTTSPILRSVDTTTQPPLAQYAISIKVTYLDKSKMIWN